MERKTRINYERDFIMLLLEEIIENIFKKMILDRKEFKEIVEIIEKGNGIINSCFKLHVLA